MISLRGCSATDRKWGSIKRQKVGRAVRSAPGLVRNAETRFTFQARRGEDTTPYPTELPCMAFFQDCVQLPNSMTKDFFLAGFLASVIAAQAGDLHTFKRIQLSDQFWSEGANFGDLNKDGTNDLI